MHELQREAQKLAQETERLARFLIFKIDADDPDPNAINIALGQAKRVRRASNVVVRELARTRDNLHSQEADNKS